MNVFRLREIRVDNYRCFGELKLPLEEDTTVLFAENGGGKTALLTALAMGLAAFQRGAPRAPEARRTARPPKCARPTRRGVASQSVGARSRGPPPWVKPSPSRGQRQFAPRPDVRRTSANRFLRPWSEFECPEIGGRCSRGTA